MALSDLPLISVLRTRMQWSQARQKLLAENVANADRPGFRPRDLKEPTYTAKGEAVAASLAVARTNAHHLAAGAAGGADARRAPLFEVKPSGNAVNLELEMMKVGQNQSDYQLAAGLYQKSLQMLRTAVGRKG